MVYTLAPRDYFKGQRICYFGTWTLGATSSSTMMDTVAKLMIAHKTGISLHAKKVTDSKGSEGFYVGVSESKGALPMLIPPFKQPCASLETYS